MSTPGSAPAPVTVEEATAYVTAMADARMASWLASRPDLLSPPAPHVAAVAARACGQASVEVALADLPTPVLAVAQSLVSPGLPTPKPASSPSGTCARATSGEVSPNKAAGPHRDSSPSQPTGQVRIPDSVRAGVGNDLTEAQIEEALGRLEALGLTMNGRPVTGLVEALAGARAARYVPLEAAPHAEDLDTQDEAGLAAQAGRLGEECVRLVGLLLEEWGREPAAMLRNGGVGVRVLSRTAAAMDIEQDTAATIVELAGGAGLLGLDEAGTTWMPSSEAPGWLSDSLPMRWASLAVTWMRSERTPWLVGTRGDDGVLQPVLGDEVEAAWARRVRGRILTLLASLPAGTMVTPTWVRAALTYARPRRPVPAGAISAILGEMELLGIVADGSLAPAGRILAELLAASDPAVTGAASEEASPGFARLAEAFEGELAAEVDMLLVQSDLTAIVPGRPSHELAWLVEHACEVESRGAALTVRFTPASVRRALDAGLAAEQILERVAAACPTPLPSALDMLVSDAARHHGAVRVREAGCMLRLGDEALAAELAGDTHLTDLGLVLLAPGVLASQATAGEVMRRLRETGRSPVLEDADGRALLGTEETGVRRGPIPEPHLPGSAGQKVRRRRLTSRDVLTVVGRLRAGEAARVRADSGGAIPATDPVHALALLRQAHATKSRVKLRMAGPDGALQQRLVRVLAVESGRVRLADLNRETELTVAVHRIAGVEPA